MAGSHPFGLVGYCFSAAAPPYTAAAGSAALAVLIKEPQRVETLRKKAALLRRELSKIGTVTAMSASTGIR